MGVSRDYLDLAYALARREPGKPRQVSLRRAVSTAYYALFHRLIEDATLRWRGLNSSRVGLSRAFQHSDMERASKAFGKRSWKGFDGKNVVIPLDLREVARTFVQLQEERHRADYNPAARFSRTDVQRMVRRAQDAFEKWTAVRDTAAADCYLVALLTGNRRRD